jgi:hypothetical protein
MKQDSSLVTLFTSSNKHELRNKQTFLRLNHLSCAQKTQTNLKVYGKQQSVKLLPDAQHTNDNTRSNEQEKKKELLIRGLIYAVCYLADTELFFHGYAESPTF